MTSPQFQHAPARGSWSMIAYNEGETIGLEFNYQTPSGNRSIVQRAKFEARWYHRKNVKVRDICGNVIFDGPLED